jgi:chaperone modulatory protein CbpM
MSDYFPSTSDVVIVEEAVWFTLPDLCRACRVASTQVLVLVEEGILEPVGSGPQDWRFSGTSLARARMALRLIRDLELNSSGTALVLELLDEIAALRQRLQRAGLR